MPRSCKPLNGSGRRSERLVAVQRSSRCVGGDDPISESAFEIDRVFDLDRFEVVGISEPTSRVAADVHAVECGCGDAGAADGGSAELADGVEHHLSAATVRPVAHSDAGVEVDTIKEHVDALLLRRCQRLAVFGATCERIWDVVAVAAVVDVDTEVLRSDPFASAVRGEVACLDELAPGDCALAVAAGVVPQNRWVGFVVAGVSVEPVGERGRGKSEKFGCFACVVHLSMEHCDVAHRALLLSLIARNGSPRLGQATVRGWWLRGKVPARGASFRVEASGSDPAIAVVQYHRLGMMSRNQRRDARRRLRFARLTPGRASALCTPEAGDLRGRCAQRIAEMFGHADDVVLLRRLLQDPRCPPAVRASATVATTPPTAAGVAVWACRGSGHLGAPRASTVRAAAHQRPAVQLVAAANPACPPVVLTALCDSPSREVRRDVAKSASIDAHAAGLLAANGQGGVALAATSNTNLPPRMLAAAAAADVTAVRAAAARNHACPPSLLADLATDPRPGVRRAVAANPALAPAIMARLAKDPDSDVRAATVSHPAATAELLERLAQDEATVAAAVACSPAASAVLQYRLSDHRLALVRAASAANPCAPETLLSSLSSDPDESVRVVVAANPRTSRMVLAVLAESVHLHVRAAAAANPNLDPGLLAKAATDSNNHVRAAAAANPSLDPHSAERLMVDPSTAVSDAALGNPARRHR